MGDKHNNGGFRPLHLLLLIPFAALLCVPLYDSVRPELFGIPFFYWYQMIWTFLAAAIMGAVYLLEERPRK
ncbi:MAG: DUF3311 domain-containing protein [Steroidobacteraceae bacterium]